MNRSFALAVFACVTTLLVGTAAIAQVESTPIPRPAKPNFTSMQFLIGTWNCVATNTRRATGYGSTLTNTMDPSGYWMNTKTMAHATSWDRYPGVAIAKTTYDAANSRWVRVTTDDEGNYGMSTSSGWNGNTIVWHPVNTTSVSSGNVVSSGDTTVTKVSSSKYTSTGSFKESGGRVVTSKGTCSKS
ncbi:MAG: hypothetical protein WAL67_08790 [Candidatus Cybelea sp.]